MQVFRLQVLYLQIITSSVIITSQQDLINAEYFYFAIALNSFTITQTINFNEPVKLQGANQNVKLSCSLVGSMFYISSTDVWINNLTLNNSNTGSNAKKLNYVVSYKTVP